MNIDFTKFFFVVITFNFIICLYYYYHIFVARRFGEFIESVSKKASLVGKPFLSQQRTVYL